MPALLEPVIRHFYKTLYKFRIQYLHIPYPPVSAFLRGSVACSSLQLLFYVVFLCFISVFIIIGVVSFGNMWFYEFLLILYVFFSQINKSVCPPKE